MSDDHNHPILSILDETMHGLVLYARNWNAACAEDLVQEAFMRLLDETPFPDSPRAWLFRVVRNLAIDQMRRDKNSPCRQGIGSWFEPSTKNPADLEDLTEALQQLPLEIREIIVSKIWGNLTFREISELTGRPISSVHHDYQTGITQLRDILTDEF